MDKKVNLAGVYVYIHADDFKIKGMIMKKYIWFIHFICLSIIGLEPDSNTLILLQEVETQDPIKEQNLLSLFDSKKIKKIKNDSAWIVHKAEICVGYMYEKYSLVSDGKLGRQSFITKSLVIKPEEKHLYSFYKLSDLAKS